MLEHTKRALRIEFYRRMLADNPTPDAATIAQWVAECDMLIAQAKAAR